MNKWDKRFMDMVKLISEWLAATNITENWGNYS